jgi:hypothetical protein
VPRVLTLLTVTALAFAVPTSAGAVPPDQIHGSGLNEGWFDFEVQALVRDGHASGTLGVEEFGADNYDIEGRVACAAVSGDGAVVAAARPETATTTRVVFLALRDLDTTAQGPDRAAPAFSVVPAGQPLSGLCEQSLWLLGATEPLDDGDVRIRDRG